jgi:3-oxoacyl-[acyl-carrier protein] reductase
VTKSGFKGKVVVVTGGGQGIGLATAEAFAAAAATVIVWERNPGGRESAPGRPPALDAVDRRQVDVLDVESVRGAAEEALERHGRVDVLINNAGVNFGDQTARGITDATWEAILGTNLKGAVNTVRALSPAMIRRGWGRIINTSSILARFPLPGFGAYAAAKAALVAITRAWARELGPHGITVNAVAPGFIDTPLNAGLGEEAIEVVVQRTPVGRRGRAADVAYVHLFLASDEAAFVNGAVVPVDGGLTL